MENEYVTPKFELINLENLISTSPITGPSGLPPVPFN